MHAFLLAVVAGWTVASYNVRNSNGDRGTSNDWTARRESFVSAVRSLDADVIGLQEVLPEQEVFLRERFDDYGIVGRHRNADGVSGEAVPVLYRKSRFEEVRSETFWLSETPDVPGSKSWRSACPRICTYVVLRDRQGGGRLAFVNTHLDHKSAEARQKGAEALCRRVAERCKGMPLILVGDHNCEAHEAPAAFAVRRFRNAIEVSLKRPAGPWRTFNGWRWREAETSAGKVLDLPPESRIDAKGDLGRKGRRIDYIYVSPGLAVERYRTLATPRKDVKSYPSDHFPVVASVRHRRPVDCVDPFVGTSCTGHCHPAACRPFGLVQAGPDTGNGTWHYASGYRYEDSEIWGFSHAHLNGTGRAALGELQIQPFAEEDVEKAMVDRGVFRPILSEFDKSSERARPGYYAVTLKRPSVRAEMTATEHVGFYRFGYAKKGPRRLFVDCGSGLYETRRSPSLAKQITDCDVRLSGKDGIEGTLRRDNWAHRRFGFSFRFSRPWSKIERLPARDKDEKAPRYVIDFDLGPNEPLLVKVALSGEGPAEAANRNLAAEVPDWDFDGVCASSAAAWDSLLSRCTVEGKVDQRINFYTSLYHLCQQPNDLADVGDKPFYSTFSLWDTFRAAHPLYTVLFPERVPGFVDSLLSQGRRTGYLPIWTLWGWEAQDMIGTHSVPVLVDAFLKGFPGDWEEAFRQVRDSLVNVHEGRIKERWDLLDRHGYFPADKIARESVSRTLECAYDDWCAAILAERLGHAEDASFFRRRADAWKNVYHQDGYARARDESGNWLEPFDPFDFGKGKGAKIRPYTEGNALQYSFHVLHDFEGLVSAVGGRKMFLSRLDDLFSAPEDAGVKPLDVTGMIGQYAHGNEPSHHVAYLYALAGRPERTAEIVRDVFDKFYLPKPDGLCGNDDCGQMSAWYVFSAMGFYPVNPCGGEYVIGAPQVPKVTVRLANGRRFVMMARNLSRENKYVKSVSFNGVPVKGGKVRHGDIVGGGELAFEMTNEIRD